jgi:hypothetical protein
MFEFAQNSLAILSVFRVHDFAAGYSIPFIHPLNEALQESISQGNADIDVFVIRSSKCRRHQVASPDT